MHSPQKAFTLVELSIVLVILGLLIGGVLTGQSLIRAAELRSIATQEQRYVTAIQTFRDKYMALPGDMPNATVYWGTESQGCPGTATTPSTTAATCNGNGDGQIFPTTLGNERYRIWQHLANAGLIEGRYSGVVSDTAGYATSSANSPVGRINSSLWYANNLGTVVSGAGQFDGQYDNNLEFGGFNTNNYPAAGVLKPEEVYNIDTKLDDGKPGTGKVVVMSYSLGLSACTDTSTYSNISANYLLTNSARSCGLYFRQAF